MESYHMKTLRSCTLRLTCPACGAQEEKSLMDLAQVTFREVRDLFKLFDVEWVFGKAPDSGLCEADCKRCGWSAKIIPLPAAPQGA